MTDKKRKAIRFAGFALIAAALGVMAYSAYNIVSAEVDTRNSLLEAEQLIEQANAFTGDPESLAEVPDASAANYDVPCEDPAASPPPGGSYDTSAPQADATPGDTAAPAQGSAESPGSAPLKSPAGTAQAISGQHAQGNGNGSGGSKSTKPEVLGMLVFKSLGNRKVPVLEGVTDKDLNSGAAHHPSTSPAGGVGNCVIFGHRNTVFRGFAKLKEGDKILLETPDKTYTYAIRSMAAVDPDDPHIFKAYGEAVMTLVTCYPFNWIGPAPRRYIVVAVLQ